MAAPKRIRISQASCFYFLILLTIPEECPTSLQGRNWAHVCLPQVKGCKGHSQGWDSSASSPNTVLEAYLLIPRGTDTQKEPGMWTMSQRNQVRNMKGSGRQSRGRHNPEHDLEKLNELESKLRGAHIPLPHDRWPSLPSSSQVICHQNITGMLLAPSLPISSGASPCDFLGASDVLPTPIPSSPVLPAGISERKTGPETCGCLHQDPPCA